MSVERHRCGYRAHALSALEDLHDRKIAIDVEHQPMTSRSTGYPDDREFIPADVLHAAYHHERPVEARDVVVLDAVPAGCHFAPRSLATMSSRRRPISAMSSGATSLAARSKVEKSNASMSAADLSPATSSRQVLITSSVASASAIAFSVVQNASFGTSELCCRTTSRTSRPASSWSPSLSASE